MMLVVDRIMVACMPGGGGVIIYGAVSFVSLWVESWLKCCSCWRVVWVDDCVLFGFAEW